MRLFTSLICLLAFAMVGASSLRAEPSAAEGLHKQLKASDDRTLGLLANRWWTLIQRQPWTDTTGKFSVDAKYVSQDAEKKTVTLLASRGKGGNRVEKEITVPLGKLSKQSQARAMRIARLMPKLEEKLAEVEAKSEEEGSSTRAEPRFAGTELSGAMPEYAVSERGIGELGEAELEAEEAAGGLPIPPRRQPSREDLPPGDRTQDPALEYEEELPDMNPYAGTNWKGREQLGGDKRFKKPEAKPRSNRPIMPIASPVNGKPSNGANVAPSGDGSVGNP